MTWTSLASVFTPKSTVDDPETQQRLRAEVASTGERLLLRALAEGRLPGESWRDQAACRDPSKRDLFFPQPVDPDAAPEGREAERVEFKRLERLNEAFATCASCPVHAECLGWGLRLAGSDKDSIIAGTTWNQRKQILAHLRLTMLGGDDLLTEVGWQQRRLILRDVRAVMQMPVTGLGEQVVATQEPMTLATLPVDERSRGIIARALKGVMMNQAPRVDTPPDYSVRKQEAAA